MKLLIFDTETTGLPKNGDIPAENKPDNWPHAVSISWIILESDDNEIIKRRKYIIRPEGWTIPQESINIHGISELKANLSGHKLQDVLLEFITESYDILVAHNLKFDYNVLRNAMIWDLKWGFNPLTKPSCCTMKLSTDICMLPGRNGTMKYPRLSELYIEVMKREPIPSRLHDSFYDTLILTEIIQNSNELRYKMGLTSKPEYNVGETN